MGQHSCDIYSQCIIPERSSNDDGQGGEVRSNAKAFVYGVGASSLVPARHLGNEAMTVLVVDIVTNPQSQLLA